MHKININLHNLKTALIFSMEISRGLFVLTWFTYVPNYKFFVAPRPRSEGGGGTNPPPPPATEQPKKPGLVRFKWKFSSEVSKHVWTLFCPKCWLLKLLWDTNDCDLTFLTDTHCDSKSTILVELDGGDDTVGSVWILPRHQGCVGWDVCSHRRINGSRNCDKQHNHEPRFTK